MIRDAIQSGKGHQAGGSNCLGQSSYSSSNGGRQARDQLCDTVNREQPEAKGLTSISFSSLQQITSNKSNPIYNFIDKIETKKREEIKKISC